ncbi:MAG: hypothetical protein Aseana_28050 [Candidatus Pelagadaptatus aseana]|uniref:hypothetical protein n=1 Tax=Candidatus Pelagadaptatus aseana TaxID=3120508 RepID=UPI0039B1862F
MKLIKWLMIVGIGGLNSVAASAGDWEHGVGVTLTGLNVQGESGFDTVLLSGPLNTDVHLDTGTIAELFESGLSLDGFSTNGDLTFRYSIDKLELEDKGSASVGPLTASADITYYTLVAEGLVDYTFHRSGKHAWGAILGLRYGVQEYDTDIAIGGLTAFDGAVDEDRTDLLLGVSYNYQISPTLTWSNQLDYGFNNSDTVHFVTSLDKTFGENWMLRGLIDVKDINFEKHSEGDDDWFKYDVTEIAAGFSLLYLY